MAATHSAETHSAETDSAAIDSAATDSAATHSAETDSAETDGVTSAQSTDPRVERSRTKVMDSVLELLVENGPRGVTVDAVAEHSGVAKSTIYRHWSTRAELITAVIRRAAPEVVRPDDETFEQALRSMVHQVADGLSRPEWGRVFPYVATMGQTMPDVAELMEDDHNRKLELVAEVLAIGIAEGRLPDDIDPQTTLFLIGGPLIMATLGGQIEMLHDLADRSVERFLVLYPGD